MDRVRVCAVVAALNARNQTVLAYSQGQLEANELIRRVNVLYQQHEHKTDLPKHADG